MKNPSWLMDYYGRDFDMLNPEVVMEGEKYAVVRLRKVFTNMIGSVGYVLIKKNGSHASTPFKSLHDGVATPVDVDKMKKELAEAEG